MRIYADSLKPNIPYKTILLSTRDTADFAVIEALEKYGLEKENPREYCIARVKRKPSETLIFSQQTFSPVWWSQKCTTQLTVPANSYS